jgi:predicted DNA-binding transcriptional regulator AlpA
MTVAADQLITRRRAAELVGVSTRTLLRWEKAGLFIAAIRIGRLVRYSECEILQFIDDLKADRGETPWSSRREQREQARVEHELRIEQLEHFRTASRSKRRPMLGGA